MPFIFSALRSRRTRRWSFGVAFVTVLALAGGAIAIHRTAGGAPITTARISVERAAARARVAEAMCTTADGPNGRGPMLFRWFQRSREEVRAARSLDARGALRADVAAIQQGLSLAHCRPSALSVLVGTALVDEAAAAAHATAASPALTDADLAAAADRVAAALAQRELRVDDLIQAEADFMLLEPAAAPDAGAVIALRERARGRCPDVTGLAACADALAGDATLRMYAKAFRQYLATRAALARLHAELTL